MTAFDQHTTSTTNTQIDYGSKMDLSDANSLQETDTLGESCSGGSTLPTGVTAASKRAAYKDPVVAKKEQRAVFWSRVVVIIVLAVAVITLATSMYLVIWRSEVSDFETQFLNHASEISSIALQNAENTIETVAGFSSTLTSYAKATNSTWPFVTVKDFSARAQHIGRLTQATNIFFAPIVDEKDREEWHRYSNERLPTIFQEAIDTARYNYTVDELLDRASPGVFKVNFENGLEVLPEDSDGPWLVNWQTFPLIIAGLVTTNYNLLDRPLARAGFESSTTTHLPVIQFAEVPVAPFVYRVESQLNQPIFEEMNSDSKIKLQDRKVVGMVTITLDWAVYFKNLLPIDVEGIIIVLSSTCAGGFVYTYQINGQDAIPLGIGDLHDEMYEPWEVTSPFVRIDHSDESESCLSEFTLSLFPSKDFEESFYTNTAIYYSAGVIAIFAFTSLVFCIYDLSVRRRQGKVMARVIRQDRIVSNMFPTAIRDILYGRDKASDLDESESQDIFGAAPLAELYPNITIVYVDIAGFTAWSSAREPPQVFTLLETIFSAFDKCAYRHNIMKIETVGNKYVAAAGLQNDEEHAFRVAKFARDCLHKMGDLTRKLEVSLGPDTTDLELRVGLHSGQVTAGVLRGERSRFQLFGDTVSISSRMEAAGIAGRIQISSSTAEELQKSGQGKWLTTRGDKVGLEGKTGTMQTYWLETKKESLKRAKLGELRIVKSSVREGVDSDFPLVVDDVSDVSEDDENVHLMTLTKMERLVEWNVEICTFLLQQILVNRHHKDPPPPSTTTNLAKVEEEIMEETRGTVLDEFQEIITLPNASVNDRQKQEDPRSIVLSVEVVSQLRGFITTIADMYNSSNAFHNFEHASHVTASVRKLLTRINSSHHTTTTTTTTTSSSNSTKVTKLVDRVGNSYGITSDPLTQFAVIFSAIIHDADHPGVPNSQLVAENTRHAQMYKKSIAEQNSVDLVWSLLMSPEYKTLRACIYSTEEELRRFRQLVVNTVMATDIVDKELQALRKQRWAMAFEDEITNTNTSSPSPRPGQDDSKMTMAITTSSELDRNRKATIVIEHLIQASDVSHTMQHWYIYKQWNERFFFELYNAYKAGRSSSIDPSLGWYKGEIGFFDYYVIPLAKKLENCGVFGVSSHEYLNYATANRDEWVREGEGIVQEYIQKYTMKHSSFSLSSVPVIQ